MSILHWRRLSGLLDPLQRILRPITQAENVADEVKHWVGVAMVLGRFDDRRADGSPRIMQELVLQAHCHVGNRITVAVREVGPGGKENRKLTLANLIGMVTELLEQQPGITLMPQLSITNGDFAFDDEQSRINTFLPLKTVLLSLCSQVVYMIEHDLVELADPGVKIARNGNVQNQGQPISP
jgi:hypothetical protein